MPAKNIIGVYMEKI